MREDHSIQNQIHSGALRVAFALLVIYCVAGAGLLIYGGARLLHNPWDNTSFESPQTYAAIYGAQTGKLYIPMSQPPYTLQAYAPLYYAIDVCVAWAAHLDIDRFIFLARLLSYIAFLLCGGMVFLICRAASIPRLHAALAALMMLGQPDMMGWNSSPRPDMLFLLAMLISLYCVVRWEDDLWRGCVLSGFFAGIALLIKQPGFAVGAGIFAVWVLRKEFKKAAVLTVSALSPVVVTLGILYWRRDPFFQQIIFAGKSLWSIRDAESFVFFHCLSAFWIVPLAIGVIGFIRAVRLDSKAQMIAAFALVNWLVGVSGLPQLGGYLNYLFAGLAGCALLLPYAIQGVQDRVRTTAFVLILSAALGWASWTSYVYGRGLINYFHRPPESSVTWLRPYRVLSDITTMNLHGREPNLLDPVGARLLELTGNWDPIPIVENLKRGDYDLIVLTRAGDQHMMPSYRGISYFSPQETGIMNERYEYLCTTAGAVVLKPRGREVAATPEMFSRMLRAHCEIGDPEIAPDLVVSPGAR
jgi:hypothetical protein